MFVGQRALVIRSKKRGKVAPMQKMDKAGTQMSVSGLALPRLSRTARERRALGRSGRATTTRTGGN